MAKEHFKNNLKNQIKILTHVLEFCRHPEAHQCIQSDCKWRQQEQNHGGVGVEDIGDSKFLPHFAF